MKTEPCQCQSIDPIFIMWLKFTSQSKSYNHIVPLIPGSSKYDIPLLLQLHALISIVRREPNMDKMGLREVVDGICIMGKLLECGVPQPKSPNHDWVQCSQCKGWHHCACIGIALPFFENYVFFAVKTARTMIPCMARCLAVAFYYFIVYCIYSVLRFPSVKRKNVKQTILLLSDIVSLYPEHGISDGIIDFYIR